MRSATRSADRPGPGRRFGQEVTMRQRRVCARAMEGAASAAAAVARPASERRVSLDMRALLPPGVKMMHGAVAVADGQFVGGRNRGGDIGFCVRGGLGEGRALWGRPPGRGGGGGGRGGRGFFFGLFPPGTRGSGGGGG